MIKEINIVVEKFEILKTLRINVKNNYKKK